MGFGARTRETILVPVMRRTPGFLRRSLCVLLVLAGVTGPVAASQTAPAGDDPERAEATERPPDTDRPAGPDDGRRTMGRLVGNIGRGIVAPWSTKSLRPLVIGSAATGAASLLDEELRDAIASEDAPAAEVAEDVFGPLISGALVAGFFTAGRLSRAQSLRDASYDMAIACLVTQGYTFALKAAVGRERPNGENNQSFPSGHTSNAWAMAAVLDGHYRRHIAIPAYSVAALVGVSRMRNNKHWFSDVVAGATLGYIVGHAVVRVNNKPLREGASAKGLAVAPILGRRTYGLSMTAVF